MTHEDSALLQSVKILGITKIYVELVREGRIHITYI